MKIPFWVSPLGYWLTKDNDDDDDDEEEELPKAKRKSAAKQPCKKAEKIKTEEKHETASKPSPDILAAQKFLSQVINEYGKDILSLENSKKLDRIIKSLPNEFSVAKDVLFLIQTKGFCNKFYEVEDKPHNEHEKVFSDGVADLKAFGLTETRAADIVNVVPVVLGMKVKK